MGYGGAGAADRLKAAGFVGWSFRTRLGRLGTPEAGGERLPGRWLTLVQACRQHARWNQAERAVQHLARLQAAYGVEVICERRT
jgi:hypothetical protein